MALDRRSFIERVGLIAFAWAAGLISPRMLAAANIDEAFVEKPVDELIELLAERMEVHPSSEIELKIPEVAENGALVPVTITSTLDKVRAIAIIAEKNRIPLIARFILDDAAEPFVQARVKLADSGEVIVLVNANDRIYSTKRFVQVTVGGCGS